jgi:hypothetical protein
MHYSNFLKTQKITGNIKAYVDVGGPFRQILHKPLAGHSGKYCTSRLRAIQANIAQAAGKLFRQILHKPLANLAPAASEARASNSIVARRPVFRSMGASSQNCAASSPYHSSNSASV